MKKSHSGLWTALAVILAAAVYSAVVFLSKKTWDMAAWILYGFTMVAFLLTAVQLCAPSRSGSGVVMDTALGIVTLVYLGIQLVFGGIVCLCFNGLSVTPVFVLEILLLAAYLVFAFLMFSAQSHSAAQDVNDRNAVMKLRALENTVHGMEDQVADPALRKALGRLAEEIHFSDTASLPGLADVESRIAQAVADLQRELEDGDGDPMSQIEAIRRLLKERDRTAAVLK